MIAPAHAQSTSHHADNDFTIVVSSCDSYAEFWHPFFTLLFRNWTSLQNERSEIPIILINSQKHYAHPRVTNLASSPGLTWSQDVAQALSQVKTPYVLYLQEDYFIHQPVDEAQLFKLYRGFKAEQAAYFEVFDDSVFASLPLHPRYPEIIVKRRNSPYRTALQASFWKTDTFKQLLIPTENPWQFEKAGSLRSESLTDEFWVAKGYTGLQYLNACHQGHWERETLQFLHTAGIDIIDKQRPTLAGYNWLNIKRILKKCRHALKEYSPF